MRSEYDFSEGVRGKYVGKVAHRVLRAPRGGTWHNPSVRLLAGDDDPVEVVTAKARKLILEAIDSSAISLPVDPFRLAELLSLSVIPRSDVHDARTVPGPEGKPIIEYNPNRPKMRVRFSICHELAHTLFPDCTEQVRHRLFHARTSSTSQELEMLCNLAAAEFLLPIGSVQEDISKLKLSVETALDLRVKYQASVEAVLLRLVGLSGSPCAMFAAVADESGELEHRRYQVEYVKSSQAWNAPVKRGEYLPVETVAAECTAIGFTAKGVEEWSPRSGKLRIEAVGVSPYPTRRLPRIVGLLRPEDTVSHETMMRMLRGDALQPRGTGEKIVAHVVNDKTPNWGAGFGRAIQERWPAAQKHFKALFEDVRGSKLGLTALSRVSDNVCAFQMVCQHGYGPSPTTRLRYEALRNCLEQLKDAATQRGASVHMPKIGTGEAGGSWGLIFNLISEELCSKGVSVTVYEAPEKRSPQRKQAGFFDETTR